MVTQSLSCLFKLITKYRKRGRGTERDKEEDNGKEE